MVCILFCIYAHGGDSNGAVHVPVVNVKSSEQVRYDDLVVDVGIDVGVDVGDSVIYRMAGWSESSIAVSVATGVCIATGVCVCVATDVSVCVGTDVSVATDISVGNGVDVS